MKYGVFFLVLVFGVPLMGAAGLYSRRVQSWMLTGLIVSAALGDMAGINFLSLEQYRGPDRGFEVTLTDLLAWGLIISLVMGRLRTIQWFPYNTWWMLAFFLVAAVSVLLAPRPLLGGFTLFKMIRVYLVYWCVVNGLRSGIPLIAVWRAFVMIGLLLTGMALKQKYLDGLYRIPGLFDHSNTIPLYANLIMPVLFLWGLCDRKLCQWQSFLSLAAVVGLCFTVVATGSRAGITLTVACLFGALLVAHFRYPSPRISIMTILILAIMAIGGLKAADSIMYRFQNAPKSSEEAREEFNHAAHIMAADHVLGVGLNNFSYVLTVESRYNSHIRVMENEEQAGVCHHIYWLTAAEMGYGGLGLFLVLIGRFLWRAGRGALRNRSFEDVLLVGSMMGFCTLHASGFLEWAFRITPVMYQFAIVSAFSVALIDLRNKRQHNSRVI